MSAHSHFGAFQERKEAAADELKRLTLAKLASQNWFGTAISFGVEKAFQPIRLAQRIAATDLDFSERLHAALPVVIAELRASVSSTEPIEVTNHYLLKHILATMETLNKEAQPGRGVPSSILLDIVGQLSLTSEFRRELGFEKSVSSTSSPPKVDVPLQVHLASHRKQNKQAGSPPTGSTSSSASMMGPPHVLKVVAKGGVMWGDCITRAVKEVSIVELADWCEVMYNDSLLSTVCDSGLCPTLVSTIRHARGNMEKEHLIKLEGLLLKLYRRAPEPLRRSLRQEIVMGYGVFVDPDRAVGGSCDRILMEAFNQSTCGSEFSLDGVLAAMASPSRFVDRFFAFALGSKDLALHLTECAAAVAPVLKAPCIARKAILKELEAKGVPSRSDALAGLLESLMEQSILDSEELISNIILKHLDSNPECVLDSMSGLVCRRVLRYASDKAQLGNEEALRILVMLKEIIVGRDSVPIGTVEETLDLCSDVSSQLADACDSITDKSAILDLVASGRYMAHLFLQTQFNLTKYETDVKDSLRHAAWQNVDSAPVLCETGILEVFRCGGEGQEMAMERYKEVVGNVEGFEQLKGRLLGALVCVLPQSTRAEFQRIAKSFLPAALATILPIGGIGQDRITEYSIELVMRAFSFYMNAPESTADILARVKGPTSVTDIQSLVRNTVAFVKDMLVVLEGESRGSGSVSVLQMVCLCVYVGYSTDSGVSEQLSILILDMMNSSAIRKALTDSNDAGTCVDCIRESLEKLRPEHSQAALDRLNELTLGSLAR